MFNYAIFCTKWYAEILFTLKIYFNQNTFVGKMTYLYGSRVSAPYSNTAKKKKQIQAEHTAVQDRQMLQLCAYSVEWKR